MEHHLVLPLCAAAMALVCALPAQQFADRIWVGGPVLTMSDPAMRAEAVAERGGRIVAVGSRAAVEAQKGPDTKVIDLGGRALLPGFVDAHGHVVFGGLQALAANLLAAPDGEVRDVATLQATLRTWMAQNEDAVRSAKIVVGFGYDNSMLAEQRHPTRDDLDAVTTTVPVLVVHQSGHICSMNSAALAKCGIDANRKDPTGGVIRRKAGSTEPDGVLEEVAFFSAVPALLGELGPRGMFAFVEAGTALWARFGYTTAQEGRTDPSVVKVLRAAGNQQKLAIDVVAYVDLLVDREFVKQDASRTYRDRVRVGGGKLTIDGSPQGFTAWRDRPYHAPVGDYAPGYAGYAAATKEQVLDAVDWAFANDVQLLTHANGEAASDLLLAAIERAAAKHGNGDRRAVLIHGQFLREDQLDAYRRLDVFPSLFPMHTFYWGDWHREHTVGPALADDISPTGWCVQRGMRFSTHHDAPVAFPDSMRVLDATVTRRTRSGDVLGPAQRVDVMTALKAMTIWPAWQHFEEKDKGSIEVGKLADFVVLSADPTAVDPETLDSLHVEETIKEGRSIFVRSREAKRTGSLWRAGPRGEQAFANFLAANAAAADWAALPAHLRRPAMLGTLQANAHGSACSVRFAAAVLAAMAKR